MTELTWGEAIDKVRADFEESMVEANIDDYAFSQWMREEPKEFADQLNFYLEGGE